MRRLRLQAPDPAVIGSLLLAYAFFAYTFRGPRRLFWQRMTQTAITLGATSLIAEPELKRVRVKPRDLVMGLASAGVLYAIFQIGDRMARHILPSGASDIQSIYELRGLRPRSEIAARLTLAIGPAEELFWHGWIQKRLVEQYGRWRGAALATVAYGSAHIASGNLTLVGAATAASAFWGLLAALGMPPGALVASHVAWDVIIFLIAPTA